MNWRAVVGFTMILSPITAVLAVAGYADGGWVGGLLAGLLVPVVAIGAWLIAS